MSSKQRKAKRRSSSSSSLKILVKCSWSGARLPAASHLSSTSTLLDVISSLTSPLPPIISNPNPTITIPQEQEPSIVYIRTTVYKRDWATTAIRDVLGVDSDAACSSVLLTLKLPSQTMTNTDSIHSSTQPLEVLQQVVEPMEIDDDSAVPPPPFSSLVNSSPPIPVAANVPPHVPTPVITPTLAIQHLLSSNFDSASKDCLLTLLKLVDNILAQPHNPKVRTVKMSNAVLKRKIGAAKGGWDILVSLGFDYQPSQPLQGMGATIGMSSLSSSSSTSSLQTKSHDNGVLTLRPERENGSELESARMYMVQMLTQELGLLPQNLPSPPTPKTTPAALRRHTSSTSSTRSTSHSSTSSFDPFKTSSYNTQSAAVGANANSIAPDGERSLSTTERQLQVLKQKQAQMEERNKALLGDNRSMVAFRPGETSTGSLGSSSGGGGGAMGGREGKGDASLLAGMMKRKEEERRKKEEGGFTTKAMRDLERMKKTKVYSHTQLRIYFPDGSRLEAKFLPSETISSVKKTTLLALIPDLQNQVDFDLYITPPKLVLTDSKTLLEEGLVPAAKVHVSWTKGGGNALPKPFLQPTLFERSATAAEAAFPDSKSVAGTGETKDKSNQSSASAKGESRENELMKRMMGKKKGLGRRGSTGINNSKSGKSSTEDPKSGSKGKPKWFKG